jgi:hypothetical protein
MSLAFTPSRRARDGAGARSQKKEEKEITPAEVARVAAS